MWFISFTQIVINFSKPATKCVVLKLLFVGSSTENSVTGNTIICTYSVV